MTEHLKIERQADIAWLVIDRTDKRNAFKYEMWRALPAMATELENDPAVRVIVLRGLDNTAFSAGADIDEFETSRADAKGAQQYNAATYAGERAIARLSKPTIAMVQGPCIGGWLRTRACLRRPVHGRDGPLRYHSRKARHRVQPHGG